MVPLLSALYCLVCGALGVINAERSKGDFTSMVAGIVLSALGAFVLFSWAMPQLSHDEPGWMVWFLYGSTMIVSAALHFLGFVLCCVLHAAGNDARS